MLILYLDCTQCYRLHSQQCWNYFRSSFFKSFSPLANPLLYYWDKRSVWILPVIDCLDCYWSSSLPLLIAWTVTEVFRYLYYILNLLSAVQAITVVQVNITIFKFYFGFYYPIMFSFEQIFFFINLVSFWNNGWAYFLFYALPYYSITQEF